MANDVVVVDVAVTWLGAAGCAAYLWFLYRSGEWRMQKAAAWLFVVLLLLLVSRGFAWWLQPPWLKWWVLTLAALLPLSITLFCERVLRRHHPLWLKLLAAGVTTLFFLCNLVPSLAGNAVWILAFMAGFVMVVVCNGVYLLKLRGSGLGCNEKRLARTLVVVALSSVPLLISDFRMVTGYFPVRLGGIAALLFVFVMLSASAYRLAPQSLITRLFGWLLGAALLAALFAGTGDAGGSTFHARFWRALPLAYAWLLVTSIFVRAQTLSARSRANDFLQWLQEVPLQRLDDFVAALASYSQSEDYRALAASELADYDVAVLWRVVTGDDPVFRSVVRMQMQSTDAQQAAAAEQWHDLFERYEMTHALPVSAQPPRIILLNLPDAAPGSVSALRASVILRLARRLQQEDANHARATA